MDVKEKGVVVEFADAGAEPQAVVVELPDTVVTDVAVGGALGSENHARFTKLESVYLLLGNVQIVHALVFGQNMNVFRVDSVCFVCKILAITGAYVCRNNSWV